jgi:SNF2 family DNA or RNA helicase
MTRVRNRQRQGESRPSLVVAPKSVVFNWCSEAERFAPQLKVVDYTGVDRRARDEELAAADLIVTSYGTLRNDVERLQDLRFDYAILDEAQAIKNPSSISAKSCRLLQADHRLALTGTPIENRLDDLWSIFEFLNPGMLGRSAALRALARPQDGEAASLEALRRGLAPFMLRRTKQQVLKELPEKTEQTLQVDLLLADRKRYDQLRDHYRASLLKQVAERGMNKARMHVLEALLRLRQSACHAGLIDAKLVDKPSGKVDALLEQVAEVAAEGHKALVFSQFTSLLAIVRRRLDASGIAYEYLDGRTRNRQERIERFQADADCPLFLISLKAGGTGLNLTAADYVFLLDPWWNPAVEAQAIDRAHRIGQQRPVFAYRIVARDTVEEKILELQRRKRGLADAIVAADKGGLTDLTAEDLKILLS